MACNLQTYGELVRQLRATENLLLYYDNRRLRLQVAIAEVCNVATLSAVAEPPPISQANTVAGMVKQTIAGMNGKLIKSEDVARQVAEARPDKAGNIRRNVAEALRLLVSEGKLRRVKGGWQHW